MQLCMIESILYEDNCLTLDIFRVETQDGGDAKVEVSPRDIIYTQPAEPLDSEGPEVLHKLDLRYGYEYRLFICFDA